MIRELQTNYGTMFLPDTDQGQYSWLSKTGQSPEDREIGHVIELMSERDKGVFIDGGASYGCWTLAMARHATYVYSFEPQIRIWDLLERAVLRNGLGNILTNNIALGEADGLVDIANLDLDTPVNFGGLSLERLLPEQPDAPMGRVGVVSIDDYFFEHPPVSAIKLDVEGYEQKALRGAAKTIARAKPILFVESVHQYTDTAALREQIEAMGYVVENREANFLCLPL